MLLPPPRPDKDRGGGTALSAAAPPAASGRPPRRRRRRRAAGAARRPGPVDERRGPAGGQRRRDRRQDADRRADQHVVRVVDADPDPGGTHQHGGDAGDPAEPPVGEPERGRGGEGDHRVVAREGPVTGARAGLQGAAHAQLRAGPDLLHHSLEAGVHHVGDDHDQRRGQHPGHHARAGAARPPPREDHQDGEQAEADRGPDLDQLVEPVRRGVGPSDHPAVEAAVDAAAVVHGERPGDVEGIIGRHHRHAGPSGRGTIREQSGSRRQLLPDR